MRSQFYHNSPAVFDDPSYSESLLRSEGRPYQNRVLGLYATTAWVGVDVYGPQQYRFQLAINSVVCEVPSSVIGRNASRDYFKGLRRGWMLAGIDAVKYRPVKSKAGTLEADWTLIVLNYDVIEFWERLRWENAFYQGMSIKHRTDLLKRSLDGDLDALTDAFCCVLAPMGSQFWVDQYERLERGDSLTAPAIDALKDALKHTEAE